MKFILPVLLLILGLGGGVGAGLFLFPPEDDLPEMALDNPCGTPDEHMAAEDHDSAEDHGEEGEDGEVSGMAYARLNNQFIVPVVHGENVASMVVMSVSIEIPEGQDTIVFEHEPKLRDSFLQVMFDHANLGGFNGNFTSEANMRSLRNALRNAARDVIGTDASDVLILELVRQDV